MGVPEGVRGIALTVPLVLVARRSRRAPAPLALAAGAVTAGNAIRVTPAAAMRVQAREWAAHGPHRPRRRRLGAFRTTARALLRRAATGRRGGGRRREALAAAEALRPDAVLLDVNLPDMDGMAVAGG